MPAYIYSAPMRKEYSITLRGSQYFCTKFFSFIFGIYFDGYTADGKWRRYGKRTKQNDLDGQERRESAIIESMI